MCIRYKLIHQKLYVFKLNHNNNNMDESESSLPTSACTCIAVLDSNQATVPVPEKASLSTPPLKHNPGGRVALQDVTSQLEQMAVCTGSNYSYTVL